MGQGPSAQGGVFGLAVETQLQGMLGPGIPRRLASQAAGPLAAHAPSGTLRRASLVQTPRRGAGDGVTSSLATSAVNWDSFTALLSAQHGSGSLRRDLVSSSGNKLRFWKLKDEGRSLQGGIFIFAH